MEMCWISWPCEWQCWMAVTPMLVRAHICHPEELSSFSRVLGMAMLGPHSPSALESEKTSPPNDRLIPKMLPARLGLFCGRDFVTGLGGKALTLGWRVLSGKQRVKSVDKSHKKKNPLFFLLITSIRSGRRSEAASRGNFSVTHLSTLARTVPGFSGMFLQLSFSQVQVSPARLARPVPHQGPPHVQHKCHVFVL